MNYPKLKLAGAVALLAVLSLLYFGFLLLTNTVVNGVYNLDAQTARVRAIDSSVGSIRDLSDYVRNRELEKFMNRASLAAAAAGEVIENNWDGKSVNHDKGVIVTVTGDKIEYPEDYPDEQKIDAAALTDRYGMASVDVQQKDASDASDDAWLVSYYKIGDGIYYLESELKSALAEKARNSFDPDNSIRGIEEALGIRVLLVEEGENEDGSHALLYKSGDLPETVGTAEQLGITNEMLETAPESTRFLTADRLLTSSGTVTVDGSSCLAYIQRSTGSALTKEKMYLVYLIPEGEFDSMTVEQTFIMLAVFLIIGIVLLVWYFSVIRLVRFYRLNTEQAQQLTAGRIAKQAFSTAAIGCVVLLIVGVLFLSLFRLFGTCNSVKKALKVLEQRVEDNEIQRQTTINELKNTYVSYAERIAWILKERPELATKEYLESFSDMIDAEYIMIYDNEGKEVLSNSRYVDMELGKTPDSSTYEFRRLLKGVPSVVHDAVTDEETGLKNALIGVSLENSREPDKYGALLIAISEDKLVPDNLETMDDVMRSLVDKGSFSFSVDPENKTIKNASDVSMVGRNAVSMDLPETALADSYRDFFSFGNTSCYGESKDIDGYLYYYAAEQPHIYKNVLLFAAEAAAAGFLFLTGLIGYMLFGYKKGFEHWSKEGAELIERIEDVKDSDDDDTRHEEDPRKRWNLSLSRFGLRTPVHNATVTLEILVVGLIISIGAWYYFKGSNSTGSLIGFVLHGQWTKGLNLFSLTSILILLAQVCIVVPIFRILLRIVTSSMGPKGETFCRLGQNLITYAGMIFFVYMALFNMGFDIGALLASLSLPAFALSLGAKDLITDILAGISIVFDGEFKVGEYVDIGGFSGKVLEIGVRTTKLQGSGNKIKIIANRDVKNVINMSRRMSSYTMQVKVSTTYYSVDELEKMLREELPALKDKIPGITNGPLYAGVDAMGSWFVTLAITAECDQADYDSVKKAMNQAVQDLFDEHGISIVF